jgi:hypothetical protein
MIGGVWVLKMRKVPSQDDVKAVATPGSQSIQCTLVLYIFVAGLVYLNMINISIMLFS